MIREVDLVSYLPEVMQEYRELRETLQIQQPEIQKLEDTTENIKNNLFILHCNEQGAEKFENMLDIKALDGDSLENRRFRILSLWNNSIPYTILNLHKKMETLCGKDGFKLEVLHEQYKVVVQVALKSKRNFEMVGEMLSEVVPANLVIDLSLLYNQHELLNKYTHGQLSAYTYGQLRNEVIEDGK